MVKNRSGLLLIAALFTLVSCASSKKEMNKTAVLHYNAGTQSLMSQDYTAALTSLMKANEIEKDSPEILTNLGMAYYFKGDTTLAVKCLKRVLELDPKNSDAKNNIASIYYQEGRYQDAEAIYKEVLKDLTYDKQARTYYNLGILELEKKRNLEKAENYFNQSLKESGDYCPSHFQLGNIHFSRRQYKKAFTSYREATMGVCLNSAPAHYKQALALIELRKFTDARMKLDEIQNKFNSTKFGAMARQKTLELDELERNYKSVEAKTAPRKVFESPEF